MLTSWLFSWCTFYHDILNWFPPISALHLISKIQNRWSPGPWWKASQVPASIGRLGVRNAASIGMLPILLPTLKVGVTGKFKCLEQTASCICKVPLDRSQTKFPLIVSSLASMKRAIRSLACLQFCRAWSKSLLNACWGVLLPLPWSSR